MNSVNLNRPIGGTGDHEIARPTKRPELDPAKAGAAARDSQPASAAADEINVSERAAAISKLVETASQSPDVRTEKVDRLRRLVESGRYQPDSRDIADAIIKNDSGQ